jgi:uncharacterized protein YndB with AHSA1/START domain
VICRSLAIAEKSNDGRCTLPRVIEFAAERVLAASRDAVWAVVSDPARFPEWFDGVEESEAIGEPGRGQSHRVAGPWGEQRFEIERLVEQWEPPRLVRWRDTAERLDGEQPEDIWHVGSWLSVELGADDEGTRVSLRGTQQPASEDWEARLLASVPLIEARLAASLERLAALVERPRG